MQQDIRERTMRKSLVNKDVWLKSTNLVRVDFVFFSGTLIESAGICLFEDWCLVVCILSEDEIALTNLFVTGRVTDTNGEPLVPCYTVREESLFPTAVTSVSGSPAGPADCCLDRVVTNLQDGIHNYKVGGCYGGVDVTPWMIVDFQSVQKITTVKIMGQPQPRKIEQKFLDVAVRVGNQSSDPSFDTDPLLATFTGPQTVENQMIELTSPTPLWGRYLSIKERDTSFSALVICTLEVY